MAIYIDAANFAEFCTGRWVPQLLQGFLISWLTQHFSDADNIEHTELKEYLWTDDFETSKILIDSHTRWDAKSLEERPAIILKRNALKNIQLGIADRHFPYASTGVESFTTGWSGSHTIFCIARSGAEAELLGTEVAHEIMEFGWTLGRELDMYKLRVAQIDEAHKLEEAAEHFVVPVVVVYAFPESWSVAPDAPIIKTINLSFFEP